MSEKEYLIAISTFTSFGPMHIKLLLKYFKTAGNLWNSKPRELYDLGLGGKTVKEFIEYRSIFDIHKYIERLKSLSVNTVTLFESEYPENLKTIRDAPYVLYIRGNIQRRDECAVAIVGTRTMTNYGRDATLKFASELAGNGVTIVSGLALGIDAVAHEAALKAGGRTIAVLASGLDIISPYANKALALEFIKNSGAVVSEYPLGHTPFKSDFAVRNRLISGLSKAVLVVEGKIKSGTFHTVSAAADQGRQVFAVPGPITSSVSEGPNYLIKNGAIPVSSSEEILEELGIRVNNG